MKQPTNLSNRAKYSSSGLFTPDSFSSITLNPTLAASLSSIANHSLTRSTWSSYATAERMLRRCCDDSKITLSYPITEPVIITFIAWLNSRGLKAATINNYLAGIRQYHLTLGLNPPNLHTDLVKQLLTGKKKFDLCQKSTSPVRLPVTPNLLRLLKLAISKDDLNKEDMRIFWLACVLAFFGCFRMGELLSPSSNNFDPLTTLLKEDLITNTNSLNKNPITFLEVRLKSTKTSGISTVMVDIYPTNNEICPVRAFRQWEKSSKSPRSNPAFQLSSGKFLTTELLNKKLRLWLKDHLDYSKGVITCHSFRAGLVSILGAAGFKDSDLKTLGRWSSRAYEIYCKLPRTKRAEMSRAMGDLKI